MKILNDRELVIAEDVKSKEDWNKISEMVEELIVIVKDKYIKNINTLHFAQLNGRKK